METIYKTFYSHAPRGARPGLWQWDYGQKLFLLTRPSRGATVWDNRNFKSFPISTHTPLAGRDWLLVMALRHLRKFLLTRPSRGATNIEVYPWEGVKFLLTRPSRGATPRARLPWRIWINFYSHAPRGARQCDGEIFVPLETFLLTRPSRGATRFRASFNRPFIFLLTRPSRGAT